MATAYKRRPPLRSYDLMGPSKTYFIKYAAIMRKGISSQAQPVDIGCAEDMFVHPANLFAIEF